MELLVMILAEELLLARITYSRLLDIQLGIAFLHEDFADTS